MLKYLLPVRNRVLTGLSSGRHTYISTKALSIAFFYRIPKSIKSNLSIYISLSSRSVSLSMPTTPPPKCLCASRVIFITVSRGCSDAISKSMSLILTFWRLNEPHNSASPCCNLPLCYLSPISSMNSRTPIFLQMNFADFLTNARSSNLSINKS